MAEPSVKIKDPFSGPGGMYEENELKELGLSSGMWGIGMWLNFSITAEDGRAAKAAQPGKLYVHHKATADGAVWNEEGERKPFHVEVSEYFKLKETESRHWRTADDKHNNWYAPDSGWCGIAVYVSGVYRVGRLYKRRGDSETPYSGKDVFDSGVSKATGERSPVGVPEGAVDGVAQEGEEVPEGGLVFKKDKSFEEKKYEY